MTAMLIGLALFSTPSPAAAQQNPSTVVGVVDVLQVSGLIDAIQVSSIEQELEKSEDAGALAFVMQLNSPGVVVSDERYAELLDRIESSSLLVGVWVGQSGSSSSGLSVLLTQVADLSGISSGSKISVGIPSLRCRSAFSRKVSTSAGSFSRNR